MMIDILRRVDFILYINIFLMMYIVELFSFGCLLGVVDFESALTDLTYRPALFLLSPRVIGMPAENARNAVSSSSSPRNCTNPT